MLSWIQIIKINFICDSGATENMVNSCIGLSSISVLKNRIEIRSANIKTLLNRFSSYMVKKWENSEN